MLANDFTFDICVSEQNFTSKPSKGDGWFKSIQFKPHQVTVSSLLNQAIHGNAFCHCFNSHSSDGSFGMPKKEDFVSTSTLFFDIDNSDKPLDDYISNLKFKPSFAYTTFGDGIDGYRFRLGYVFNKPIVGAEEYNSLYSAVNAANGFQHLDSLPCSQIYFGTKPYADTYTSDYIYRSAEFNDYREQTPSNAQETGFTSSSTTINGDILRDIRILKFDDFFRKYAPQYYGNYKCSLETPLILDESGMFYTFPEEYYVVKHKKNGGKTLKWQIGNDRKKKLFFTAKIMLANLPSLSIDNLLFNLVCEREWYYSNTDNKLNNDVLIETTMNAFKYDYQLTPNEHTSYRVNKAFWEEQGMNVYQAMNCIRRYQKALQVNQYYNPYLSYNDNVRILNDNGIKISSKTLKRMVTRGDIRIDKELSPHTYLSECRSNVTNPVTNGILQLIQEDGTRTQGDIADMLELDIRTVKRYFKEMNGKLIRRDGNNRTGRWIVIEPLQ